MSLSASRFASTLLRSASSSSSSRLSSPLFVSSVRHMSDSGERDFRKKESTQEKEFVSRQERESLKALLKKLETEADPDGSKAKAGLDKVLQEHGVKSNSKLHDALLKWRHSTH